MSNETAFLALHLEGPLQSWGFDSQFNRRNTGLMPTKSGILGICLAALGIDRGSEDERLLLQQSVKLRLLAIAVPRKLKRYGDQVDELPVRRITDYHTVQNTKTAEGKTKDTHLTFRQYLCDAFFVCVLFGDSELVRRLGKALENPVWGIWLGRKACIPAAPVFIRVFTSEQEALEQLLGGRSLSEFSWQREVDHFDAGKDSLPDQPVCFAAPDGIRRFTLRRVDRN